eukprot:Sspe_Gene.57784::Locus_31707_Transcript_2_3_Confidence_0.500_Length_1191::g.57784::m.57784
MPPRLSRDPSSGSSGYFVDGGRTRLLPQEIAVLKAVQPGFRALRESNRSTDALVQQVAARLDKLGDRYPGYWQAGGARMVKAWLMNPSGLPACPRPRADERSISPSRSVSSLSETPSFAGRTRTPSPSATPSCNPPARLPPPAAFSNPLGVDTTFRKASKSPGPPLPPPPPSQRRPSPQPSASRSPSLQGKSSGGKAGTAQPPAHFASSRARSPDVRRGEEPSVGKADEVFQAACNPSSIVAASWKLYDEALRRFTVACDESDALVRASIPTLEDDRGSPRIARPSGKAKLSPPAPASFRSHSTPSPASAMPASPPFLPPYRKNTMDPHAEQVAQRALKAVEEARAVLNLSSAPPT